MRQVFLVRHAKSSWSEPGLGDHARPLTDRGVADAARMFSRLRDSGTTPEAIVSSDAVRARATAVALAQALGKSPSAPTLEPDLYHASAEEILEVIRGSDDAKLRIAFVGHNPGFTDVANRLVDALTLDNLPTCGVVGIVFSANRWRDIAFGTGRLVYFDYPKNSSAPMTSFASGPARDRE